MFSVYYFLANGYSQSDCFSIVPIQQSQPYMCFITIVLIKINLSKHLRGYITRCDLHALRKEIINYFGDTVVHDCVHGRRESPPFFREVNSCVQLHGIVASYTVTVHVQT